MLRPSKGTRPLMHQAPLSNKHLSYDSASHTGSAYFMTVMFISWRVYPRPHSTSARSSSSLGFFLRFFFYSAMHPFLFFIHSVSPLLCNTKFSHAMPLLLLIHFVRLNFFVFFLNHGNWKSCSSGLKLKHLFKIGQTFPCMFLNQCVTWQGCWFQFNKSYQIQ